MAKHRDDGEQGKPSGGGGAANPRQTGRSEYVPRHYVRSGVIRRPGRRVMEERRRLVYVRRKEGAARRSDVETSHDEGAREGGSRGKIRRGKDSARRERRIHAWLRPRKVTRKEGEFSKS